MKFPFALLFFITVPYTASADVPVQAAQAVSFYHGCMFGVLSTDSQPKTMMMFENTSVFCATIMRESEVDRTYLNQPGVMTAMAAAFAKVEESLKKVFLK
jgi:hypothetical protein